MGWCVRGNACAAIVGDITPSCGISKQKKAELEADAIRDIQKMLGDDTAIGEIRILCSCGNLSLRYMNSAATFRLCQGQPCMRLPRMDLISFVIDHLKGSRTCMSD